MNQPRQESQAESIVGRLSNNYNLEIRLAQMGTPAQKAVGEIMRGKWPDWAKDIKGFEEYASDHSCLTEALIVTYDGGVIGGNYMTTHPDELEKFQNELQDLKKEKIVAAEFFILRGCFQGKGMGSQLIQFMQRTYFGKGFEGIILRSNIPETHKFYTRPGGILLFDGRSHGTEYHTVWRQTILKKGSVFLYTPESCR